MQINEYHGSYNITKRSSSVKYIVIHYVGAGSSAAGSALANCKYFSRANRNASAHYFIDDSGIWEYANPRTYATWHCGDGKGRYGITNQNSIGIEVCNNGGAFTATEIEYLKQLVQKLMADFGVSASNVVRHYDASTKRCPLYYVQNSGEWDKLKAYVTGGASSAPQSGTSAPAPSPAPSKEVSGSVAEVQKWLNANYGTGLVVDNDYGKKTKAALVKALQTELNKQRGAKLAVDGSFGPKTKAACINVRKGAKGNITKILQGALICHGYGTNGFDGDFGSGTQSAVKSYQRSRGLSADGVAGKNTFAKLLG